MATIHHTTMKPTKLELLQAWLPSRPWFAADHGAPALTKTGGFRLDDPAGEVGIEFMIVTADGGDQPAYHLPLTYRGEPHPGLEDALVGTAEHGVLGSRWIYDGTRDPVLISTLMGLLGGELEAQAQSVTDAPDPTVIVTYDGPAAQVSPGLPVVTDDPGCTSVIARTDAGPLEIRVTRALDRAEDTTGSLGSVSGRWTRADGGEARSHLLVVRESAPGT